MARRCFVLLLLATMSMLVTTDELLPVEVRDRELLLQQRAGEIQPTGAPIRLRVEQGPGLRVEKCISVEGERVFLSKCDAAQGNQKWVYDRAAGGAFKATTNINGQDMKVCLTREEDSVIASPCASDEEAFSYQVWSDQCGAYVNGKPGAGRVLEAVGSKVMATFWSGKNTQLWTYDEVVHHDQCSQGQFKVMKFDGSKKTAGKIDAFLGMPTNTISLSAWINAKAGTAVSYGTAGHLNAFTLSTVESLQVSVLGQDIPTQVSLAGLGWIHVTVTWSSEGELVVYVNGRNKFSKKGVAVGKAVTPGGCLMLGQQQTADCRASTAGALEGEMANVQVWSELLDSKSISSIMTDPVHQRVIQHAGSADAPKPQASLRLALLTRQFSSEELGVRSPPVCDLESYRMEDSSALRGSGGYMMFSAYGGGHYKNFAGCHFTDQGVGEYVAARVQDDFKEQAPLTIQYRTASQPSKCKWCKNGFVAFIDGCAVRYGKDRASAGFGGITDDKMYAPVSRMNGKTHEGWKFSDSKTLEVNFGTGPNHKKHFEVRVNDGSYIRCAPRSMFVSLPDKYRGKIEGVGGSGENGDSWTAGPNFAACPQCIGGKAVEGSNNICHAKFVDDVIADPFNGNAFMKPVAKFLRSWQVDGEYIPSIFAYNAAQGVGQFNVVNDLSIKPPVELKQSPEGSQEAKKACAIFGRMQAAEQTCIFGHKMFGDVAVQETKEDVERAHAAAIREPTKMNIRDLSRFSNDVTWSSTASWSCTKDLQSAVDKINEAKLQANSKALADAAPPLTGRYITILMNHDDAKAQGLIQSHQSYLEFSEIEIYDEDGDRIVPSEVKMSSIKVPEAQHQAMNCFDKNVTSVCTTREGSMSTITLTLAVEQRITSIRLKEKPSYGNSTSDGGNSKNLGAVVLLSSEPGFSKPSWASAPITEVKRQYIFRPSISLQTHNLTESVEKEFVNLEWSTPTVELSKNSIFMPGNSQLRTRKQYSPGEYLMISVDTQKVGSGMLEVSLFSRNCRLSKGVSLTLGKDGKKLFWRHGAVYMPILEHVADATKHHSIGLELLDSYITVFLDGEAIVKNPVPRGIAKSEICFTSYESGAMLQNIMVKQLAPVGPVQIAAAKEKERALLERTKSAILKAKRSYARVQRQNVQKQKEVDAKQVVKDRVLEAEERKHKAWEHKAKANVKAKRIALCQERKVKQDETNTQDQQIDALLAERNTLKTKQAQLESQVVTETKNLAQENQNIAEAKRTIESVSASLDAHKRNLSLAFSAAEDSLQLYKAHSKAASDIGDTTTSDHEEYLRQAAALRAAHQQRAEAINLLHDSIYRKNDAKEHLKETKLSLDAIVKKLGDSKKILDSLVRQRRAMAAANKVVKPTSKSEEDANSLSPEEAFQKAVQKFQTAADSDDAFELMLKMQDAAKEGLSARTPAQQKLAKMQLADAEAEVSKYQREIASLKSSKPDANVANAEAQLRTAEEGGDRSKISAAKQTLSSAMNQDESTKRRVAMLREQLQQSGDAAKKAALQKMIEAAERTMESGTLDNKVAKLKASLAEAMKACNYDHNDPKVRLLKEALKTALAQSKLEQAGREADAEIAAASNVPSGSTTFL